MKNIFKRTRKRKIYRRASFDLPTMREMEAEAETGKAAEKKVVIEMVQNCFGVFRTKKNIRT